MQARMKNPALVLGAFEPVQALYKATYKGGVDPATLELVHLRISQINGCSACVDSGARAARKAGETEERLAAVAAWREAPYLPTTSAPRWPWPKRPPGSLTARTRSRTRSGMPRPITTTKSSSPRSCS